MSHHEHKSDRSEPNANGGGHDHHDHHASMIKDLKSGFDRYRAAWALN